MLLSQLIERAPPSLACQRMSGKVDRPVGRVSDRDADILPGDVFVALRGAHVDGHDRLGALGHAAALIVERDVPVPEGPTVLRVADTRRALAHLCAARMDFPGHVVPVIGVTGTNGKTSITWIIAAMARAAGWKAGIIGTTGVYVGDERLETHFTTPTAPETQTVLARMRDAGCRLVAMEVSSIGLAAFRADAIPFVAGIFTNLTRDHLDYHGSMARYAEAKRRLFHELLEGIAVLNALDPAAAAMAPPHRPVWWTAPENRALVGGPALAITADDILWDTRLADGRRGFGAHFQTPAGSFSAVVPLIGAHNLDNVLGAVGGALAAGVPLDACRDGLATMAGIPGRLEAISNTRGLDVYVDFAHTDDALARVLGTLRGLGPRRIVTVFGCGGDRDPGKRPLMGRAAAAGSDLVVVTSDNPRSEPPEQIIADILPGVGAAPHLVEPDRHAAIALALAHAHPGDTVLIAGKGHETTQTVGAIVLPFDDRAVVRALLESSP